MVLLFQKKFLRSIVIIFVISFFGCKQQDDKEIPHHFSEDEGISFDYLPTSTTNAIIKHKYYSLSYKENSEQAEWVAYKLNREECLKANSFKRPYFISDPLVATKSADYKNYKKSGFDKGHLCPAGDRSFSKDAYDETFYTSNISPQKHNFNSGIWNTLEQKVRYWATKYETVYVVTGGILERDLPTIGTEKVAVPKEFYKVLYCKTGKKHRMIAFVLPAENSKKALYEFVVSVDDLELKTGIDFFPKLEDKIETVLEKNRDYKYWSF
jgi:endonuclease G